MTEFQTPHLEKLNAALANEKLPEGDAPRVQECREHYAEWIESLNKVAGTPDERLERMVSLLNEYRKYVDVELIFDSPHDFLYRQKGQLKLDNSVIEEFLPRLFQPELIPELKELEVLIGPASCFSSLYFNSSLATAQHGGGMNIRTKDQDFAICRPLYIQTCHSPKFEAGQTAIEKTNISYVAAECKTNLDKTMFQEACATAHDVRVAVSGARYYLLCEWLDMSPISTAGTDIDEVIILRRAKRINANVRSAFATVDGRKKNRKTYVDVLEKNPLRVEMFRRFLDHVRKLLANELPSEQKVLDIGYF